MTSSMCTSVGVALAQGWAMSMIVTGGGGEPVGGAGAGGLEPYPPPPPPPHAQSRVAKRAISGRRVTMPSVYVHSCEVREAHHRGPCADESDDHCSGEAGEHLLDRGTERERIGVLVHVYLLGSVAIR